jgi:ATP-dependent Zn protease
MFVVGASRIRDLFVQAKAAEPATQSDRSAGADRCDAGGRESEALAIGDITTGAENDFVQATRLVRRMITRGGDGESLGPVALQADEDQPLLGYQLAQRRDYREATAARIDQKWSI